MKVYKIRGWNRIFENNRTRDLKHMAWIPVPNSHDGDGYTTLVERKNGAEILGAWLVILQVASKCDPRGTLLRRGGIPHSAASISRITRLPEKIIAEALLVCSTELQWIEIESLANIPHDGAASPQESAAIPQDTDQERKKERTEQNGRLCVTLDDVKSHFSEINIPLSEANKFFNYYESNGWKVGKNPMKSWKSAAANWKQNFEEKLNGQTSKPPLASRPTGGNL